MKLKKIDAAQTIGVLANLGVIAGIVFLAIEIAQNTAAVRAQTVQSVQMDMRDQLDFSEREAEISVKDPTQRTPAESLMRTQYFFRAMRSYENQWYHYKRGYLEHDLFSAYQQHLRITLGLENFMDLWERGKNMGFFHPDFAEYVDEFLVDNSTLPDSTFSAEEKEAK